MLIKCDKKFDASLDDGLTVTSFLPGEHDVPDWVGEMAIKHFDATKIKALTKPAQE